MPNGHDEFPSAAVKPGVRTSEFGLSGVAIVLIAIGQATGIDGLDEANVDAIIAGIVGLYSLARGLAKLGARA